MTKGCYGGGIYASKIVLVPFNNGGRRGPAMAGERLKIKTNEWNDTRINVSLHHSQTDESNDVIKTITERE